MRPHPRMREERIAVKKQVPAACKFVLGTVLLAVAACTLGCGGGGAGSVTPPSPTPPSIQVVVTPRTGTVFLGGTLAFSATVSNTTDTAVSWSVNGAPGGSVQAGTISADGVYTAPPDLPQGGTIQVTATSHADASKFATASVAVSSDVAISVNPNAPSVELGSTQTFHASIVSSGRPDTSVHWGLSGAACPNACGSLDASGNYTAPQILPVPANVTITATSAADSSRQSSANVTISSQFTLQLTAPTTLQPGTTQALVATMTPVPGSNPNSLLAWSVTGTGCSGGGCGILTVTTTQAAGGVPIADTANYTAPSTPPQPNTITVTVTPQADPLEEGTGQHLDSGWRKSRAFSGNGHTSGEPPSYPHCDTRRFLERRSGMEREWNSRWEYNAWTDLCQRLKSMSADRKWHGDAGRLRRARRDSLV
jgi:hypothetical protein